MSNAVQQRSAAKEIFMADIQQTSWACARLHCAYVIEPVSQFQMLAADTVIGAFTDRLAVSRGMNVHRSTDERIVVSFSDQKEALRALKFGGAQEIFRVNGCPYRFSAGDAVVHTRSITVCRQVHLTLKRLPLQMWTAPIVEQVLSPYCALEYIDQETVAMDDPLAFTCIVRCQKAIPIPDKIAIKVPQDSDSGGTALSLFFNRYMVLLDKTQYIHGVTRRCKYQSQPTATTINHIVSPAKCYISPRMFDPRIIQKCPSAVVLHPKPDTYFADLRHVCVFVRENIHVRVRVKMLADNAFLLYFAEEHPFMSLHAMLSVSLEEWIVSGEVEMVQWTLGYGSVGDVVTQIAELKITGLPCNLNSVPVIEYILSPFAFVRKHITAVDDDVSDIGKSIVIYRCSVWCVSIDAIPSKLRVKVLLSSFTDLTEISSDGKCRCPLLSISMHARAVLDSALPI